jgi:hypothetical protein
MADTPVLTWRNDKETIISQAPNGKNVWLDGQPITESTRFKIRRKG